MLAEAESVSQQFDLKNIIQSNKNITLSPLENHIHESRTTNQEEALLEGGLSNKKKAEELVSKIINENGLTFNKENHNDRIENNESTSTHTKSGVKFNEDVTTVNITPRNIGRKVEELHHSKKKSFINPADNFVDLIEVKNRIEPVLSTGKAEMSQRDSLPSQMKPSSKPPSGRSASVSSKTGSKQPINSLIKKTASDLGPRQNSIIQNRPPIQARPRSANAPLNRAPKVINTVTVDYGENEPKEDDSETSKKKKRRKAKADVITMMEKLALDEEIGNMTGGNRDNDEELNEAEFNKMFSDLITAPTVYKSDPEKNYYEISRHSSASNVHLHPLKEDPVKQVKNEKEVPSESTVYKTTKTIEFDEENPKEVTVKSVIDPQVVHTRDKDRMTPELKPRKPASRPSSAKVGASIESEALIKISP